MTDPLAPPEMPLLGDLDSAELNEVAALVAGDGYVPLTVRYGAAARILRSDWLAKRQEEDVD